MGHFNLHKGDIISFFSTYGGEYAISVRNEVISSCNLSKESNLKYLSTKDCRNGNPAGEKSALYHIKNP